ncbi:hypothetical protein ABZ883_34530 [Streptomyces sp. NPDC046977]|uniref:hypothetical protein n=1 Tax=Streptomyces sp. NPDC046977 TaxID=3154703 RepID=UPI0033FA55A7
MPGADRWLPVTINPITRPFEETAGADREGPSSPAGRLLESAGEDSTVRLRKATTHRRLAIITGRTGAVRTLAASSTDGTVRLRTSTRRPG